MTIGTEAGSTYVLGTTQQEYERVRRQAEVWQRATERVLDRVDPAPGSRCLDAGCGPGVTMRQLAQRVGPAGTGRGYRPQRVPGCELRCTGCAKRVTVSASSTPTT